MSLYQLCDFSKGVMEVAKIAFSLERVYGWIFLTEFGGIVFPGFFPGLYFGKGENTLRKKPRRNSVNKNSSKVRRNTSLQENWKKSQTYT